MKIAQVVHLGVSVPPEKYGGTERVVSHLTEELVRLGHDVTLFASGDSTTSAKLVPGCDRALSHTPFINRDAVLTWMLERVWNDSHEFEMIHSHLDFVGFPLARRSEVPIITTLHGHLGVPELAPVYREFWDIPVVSISHSQRAPFPSNNWQANVYHGLPADLHHFHPKPQRYLAFLGRMSPEKSPDVAIRIAQRLRIPLRMAAKVDPVDREYFETRIAPLLADPLIQYIGEITDKEKDEFLGNACAALCPYQPESFGLVVIEALACGTPVVTYRHGSFPELIDHETTGFLCNDEDDMVQAVRRIGEIDRVRCRQEFEERFTVERMTKEYVQVYERLIREKAEKEQPVPRL
ncbi:MAG: putative Glycosyl transferase, group 1 [Nitrospira sp.]|jgi:glycosyltransferase involved in cell wall biosynthesis|nr:putative Glycosyl transferase, group 1 [Nitrospira sp.]